MGWLSWVLVLAVIALLFSGVRSHADDSDVVVFAAVSLQDSLGAVADAYAAGGHPRPKLSFGPTPVLAKQIESGAPADLFLAADEQWMDYLVARGLVVLGTRAVVAGNQLVLIAPATRPFKIEIQPGFALADVLGTGKLAMADPDSVPAGRYGKAALENLGIWSVVEANVLRAADARAALGLVERDEARAGIVYSTDALASKHVVLAAVFPDTSHPVIEYPVSIVAGHNRPPVDAFREFLLSPQATAIFEKFGFLAP